MRYIISQIPERRLWRTKDWKDFHYTEKVSFDSFFHSLKNHNHSPSGILYHACDEVSWNIQRTNHAEFSNYYPIFDDIPEINTIWEFYKQIGYEWRKKRWTK